MKHFKCSFVRNPTRRFVWAQILFCFKRIVNESKTPMFQAHSSPSRDPCPPLGARVGLPRSQPGWKLPISTAATTSVPNLSIHQARFSLSDSFRPNGLRSPRRHNKIHSTSTLGKKKLFNINPIIGKKNVQVRCPCLRRWRSCGRSSPLRYLPQVHPVNVT